MSIRRSLIVAGVAALIAIASGGAWMLRRGSRPVTRDRALSLPADQKAVAAGTTTPVARATADAHSLQVIADADRDLERRQLAFDRIARLETRQDLATLLALIRRPGRFHGAAVRALRQAPPAMLPHVVHTAVDLLHSDQIEVLLAAPALATLTQDPAVVDPLLACLHRNRHRADGHHRAVRRSCAEALAIIGDPAALPVFADELMWALETGRDSELGYARVLVDAVLAIDRPGGIGILRDFRDRIVATLPAQTEPRRFRRDLAHTVTVAIDILRQRHRSPN